MATSIQILLGFMFGWVGLIGIGESPASGISALLLAGVLVLRGIDHLWRIDEEAADR